MSYIANPLVNSRRVRFWAGLIALASLVSGCATNPQSPIAEATPEPEIQAPEPPAEIVYKPFEPETLYSLMVAELALARGRYDISLGNYVQQAHATRDPGITGQATRLARYLGVGQAALNGAMLWLEIEPDNIEARVTAANELAQLGRLTEAFALAKPLANSPAQSIFQTIAARAAHGTHEQRQQLISEFTTLIEQHPESNEILISNALLLQADQQYAAALPLVQKALAREPEDLAAAGLEAKLLHQLKQPDLALAKLEALLLEHPGNIRLRHDYARILTDTDLTQAKKQFEILVQQSPDDSSYMFALALINTELGFYDIAKRQFSQLTSDQSRGTSAHFYLGELAREEDNLETALTHYLQVTSGPDFLAALNRATSIWLDQGQVDSVREHFDTTRSRFPNQEERLYLVEAELLANHQFLDQAVEALTEGLTFHANSPALLYARAMFNEQRDRLALMEQDLRTIITFDASNATALNALGYTLANRTDRYQEAFELITQAIRLKPEDPAIIDSLGWVQYRLGNYQEALVQLREALRVFPDHEVAAHLGEVLWVTGDNEEALQVWRRGLELNPDSKIIPEVMRRLNAQP